MSSATKLVEDLSSRGVEFVLEGGVIRFRGPRSIITPRHVETLKEHRGEVVQFLLSRRDYVHGQTVCGRPLTWTGKVISLADWRQLSNWGRHGSTGKQWNGKSRQWEKSR